MRLRRWIPVLLGPILMVLFACAGSPPPAPVPPERAAAAGALPDDAQGLGLFLAANRGAIERADLAVERAAGDDTRALARRLAEAHRDFAARLGDLASRLAIAPAVTAESRQVVADDGAELARLRQTAPEAFDRTWREAEAAAQERLRQRLDAVLVPAARDEEYRAALLEIRPRVVEHLEALRPAAPGAPGAPPP